MGTAGFVLYLVVLLGIMYFLIIKPQKTQQKKREELFNSLAIGDYCVTTGGMYGQIIDITSDMVIVEFGNKNCRIPMLRSAIASIEKADAVKSGISNDAKESIEENN